MEQAARRVAIASLLFFCSGCAGRLEQQVLRSYFDSCGVADLTLLANGALVWLHPVEDGVVGHFRIAGIGPRTREPAATNPAAIRLSLHDPIRPRSAAGAVLVTETVTVSAEVHRRGSTFDQDLRVTLARAETPDVVGRWIVVRLAPGGHILPAASSAPPSETAR